MKKLLFTLGISGSGKSTYLKGKSPIVETDQLRKFLLKDVNNWNHEKMIFNQAEYNIIKLFENHNTVYFESTMIDTKHRNNFLGYIRQKMNGDIEFEAKIFEANADISMQRIKKDIREGVDRADITSHILREELEKFNETILGIFQGKDRHLTLQNIII